MDPRVQAAKEHHQKAQKATRSAATHLMQRNEMVRRVYADGEWSYGTLAKAIGCTPEVIAKIVRPQAR